MEQFEFDKIPVDQITTGFFQVAIKNAGAKLDELEAGIKAQGLLQPIGVAKSQITEDNDDFEWEVLDVTLHSRITPFTTDQAFGVENRVLGI